MILNPENILSQYLNPGEEILWCDQPIPDKPNRALRPIRVFSAFIGMVFLVYAVAVAAIELYPQWELLSSNPSMVMTELPAIWARVYLWLIGGVLFLLFSLLLPILFRMDNNIVYAITNRRIMIIEYYPDPVKLGQRKLYYTKKTRVTQWGPGDIIFPSKHLTGKTSGNIMITEEDQEVGDIAGTGIKRTQVAWVGFKNIDNVNSVFQLLTETIQNWQKASKESPRELINSIGAKFIVPHEWTTRSFMVKREHRDNIFFATLMADFSGQYRLIQTDKVEKNWNTLILTKRIATTFESNQSHTEFLTMIVEIADSKKMPVPGTEVRISPNEKVDLEKFFKEKELLKRKMSQLLMICLFTDLFKINPEKKTCHVKLNANSKEMSVNDMKSFQLEGALNIMGRSIKFKQVYAYQAHPTFSTTIHLRFTFWAPEKYFQDKKIKHYAIFDDLVSKVKLWPPPREVVPEEPPQVAEQTAEETKTERSK